jgi:hypothetical protein
MQYRLELKTPGYVAGAMVLVLATLRLPGTLQPRLKGKP